MIKEMEKIGRQYKACADTVLNRLEDILKKEGICNYERKEEEKLLIFSAGGYRFKAFALPSADQIVMETVLVKRIPGSIFETTKWIVRQKNQTLLHLAGTEAKYYIRKSVDKKESALVFSGKITGSQNLEKLFYQLLLYMIKTSKEEAEYFQNIADGKVMPEIQQAIKNEYNEYKMEWEEG